MSTNPDDLAYPGIQTNAETSMGTVFYNICSTGGLTKREYFAAMAMQGLLSNPNPELHSQLQLCCVNNSGLVGDWAVAYADGLISALNKETAQ